MSYGESSISAIDVVAWKLSVPGFAFFDRIALPCRSLTTQHFSSFALKRVRLVPESLGTDPRWSIPAWISAMGSAIVQPITAILQAV
jgi:hypothetical protein